MRDIQQQIEDADRTSKQKAENILKTMADSYSKQLSEQISYELQMAKSETRAGNLSEAERHKLLAEIYRSVLDATKP